MTNQVRTVLAARKIRKRFLAHFMKLDTFSEFIPKLKAAMEKAKDYPDINIRDAETLLQKLQSEK